MSAVVIVLPVVRAARFNAPAHQVLQVAVPERTVRRLSRLARAHWDGDLAQCAADLLAHAVAQPKRGRP